MQAEDQLRRIFQRIGEPESSKAGLVELYEFQQK